MLLYSACGHLWLDGPWPALLASIADVRRARLLKDTSLAQRGLARLEELFFVRAIETGDDTSFALALVAGAANVSTSALIARLSRRRRCI